MTPKQPEASRYANFIALLRNSQTSTADAMAAVCRLNPRDIKALADHPDLPEFARQALRKFISGPVPSKNRRTRRTLDKLPSPRRPARPAKPPTSPPTWELPAAVLERAKQWKPHPPKTLDGVTYMSVPGGIEGDGWSARLCIGDSMHFWSVEINGERLPNDPPTIFTVEDVIREVVRRRPSDELKR